MAKRSPVLKTVLLSGIVVGEVLSTGKTERDIEVTRQFLKGKGLYKEVTLFQAMFSQALAFANTSALLYERDLRRQPCRGVSIAPFVVNAALSIELYLKALAEKHGAYLGRGHELVKLFDALPFAAHGAIDQVTPQCAADRALGEVPRFRFYLETLNAAFVEWRYCYELERTGMIAFEPTIFVMQVLHEACRLLVEGENHGAEV